MSPCFKSQAANLKSSDYYEVLGVARDASESEITKACGCLVLWMSLGKFDHDLTTTEPWESLVNKEKHPEMALIQVGE